MTEGRNTSNVSISLSCVTIGVVLSVMVGQNVLQTSFSTSGLLLMVLTLCAALKRCMQTSVGKQSCVHVDKLFAKPIHNLPPLLSSLGM